MTPMTGKLLHSFSVFVSVATKNFTKLMEVTSYEATSIEYYEPRVHILALVIQQVKHIFSEPYHIGICGLSGCSIFLHIIS
jgi:hypothetical protein